MALPVAYWRAGDQSIVETLMVSLAMIVLDELRDDVPEVPLTDGNDAIETFFLDRPDESLGVPFHDQTIMVTAAVGSASADAR